MGTYQDQTTQALRLAAQALRDRTGDRRSVSPKPVDDFDAGWRTGMGDAIALLDQLADDT